MSALALNLRRRDDASELSHSPQKLSFSFDASRLAAVIARFAEQEWRAGTVEPAGHAAAYLVAVGGVANPGYALAGPMLPTPLLERCPEFLALLEALAVPVSRCRLLRLAAETAVPPSADHGYHAFRRWRIYFPIVTEAKVSLVYHDNTWPLAAGEAWLCDPSQPHGFRNDSGEDCIHLAVDLRELPRFGAEAARTLAFEPYRFEVLEPAECSELATAMLSEVERNHMPEAERLALAERLRGFGQNWERCFQDYGHAAAGELAYRDLLLDFEEGIAPLARPWLWEGRGEYAIDVLLSMLKMAPEGPQKKPDPRLALGRRLRMARRPVSSGPPPVFDRPLFIISAPRSGSTLLFETLAGFPELWTIGEESHELIEGLPELHPAAHGYASNRLTALDATPEVVASLQERFTRQLLNRDGQAYASLPEEQRPERVRLLEKTPKNALRIPFLRAAFPGARFLVLYRRPEETLVSILDGWRSRRFVAYQPLPGWPHRAWKFLLVPGWEDLAGKPLVEVAAHQWRMAYRTILDDLLELPPASWRLIRYAELVAEPRQSLERIAEFCGLETDERVTSMLAEGLPLSSMTFSAPDPDKWRRQAAALAEVLPGLEALVARIEALP
jgi:hypothetical protein